MRIHEEDPRVAVLDTIGEGKHLRRNVLQRLFGKQARFQAAIHSSAELDEITEMSDSVLPYLEEVFSADNDDWSHAIQLYKTDGIVYPSEILWAGMSTSRGEDGMRRFKRPKKFIHEFGMSKEFGTISEIFAKFSKYIKPVIGRSQEIHIAKRTSTAEFMHLDERIDDAKDSNVINFALGTNRPAAIIQTENGKIIRPKIGSLVAVNETVWHASPSCEEFRVNLSAQPSAFSF